MTVLVNLDGSPAKVAIQLPGYRTATLTIASDREGDNLGAMRAVTPVADPASR